MSHSPMIDLLLTRRSVAPLQMSGPAPDADELKTLLTIAARVPDHGKLAPWRFIIFEDDARARAGEAIVAVHKSKHPDASADALQIERMRFQNTPMVIAVISKAAPHVKIPEWEQQLSAGAVCMNLIIAANAMGFVTKWLTEWYAFDKEAGLALGVKPEERVAGFIHIGRSTEKVAERERPVLSDITTYYGAS